MGMKDLNHFLSRSLRWLGFEALTYQLLLLGHQFVLFRVSDYRTYGLIGATFSLVYLVVALADCGLEASVSPFFSALCRSRKAFRRFFLVQVIPNLLIWAALFAGILGLWYLGSSFHIKALASINFYLLLILGGLALAETVKKTLRTVMHLAFLNRTVAFIEVFTIIGYISFVWVLYGLGFPVGLRLVFVPMFITSVLSTFAMVFFLYRFSVTLPLGATEPPLQAVRVVKSRLFNYLNQLSHLLFSSNFLVPFFALQFGLAHAGVFKLVSHVAYGLTSIVRKIFGLTSDALLARAKDMALEAQQIVFVRVTERLYHALYGIVIFFGVNYGKITAYNQTVSSPTSGPLVYLFLLICLSETLFITYEKLYITQERAGRLLAFNMATMALIYGVMRFSTGASQLGILLAIIIVRAGMFALLSIVSFYTWRIKPQLSLRPHYLVAALCVALGFFVLF